MIGDPEILISRRSSRLCHDLERVRAIRSVGVGVQNAPYISVLNQDRKFAPLGKCDLPTSLPQLGFDILEAERFVDRLLARARHRLLSATKAFLIENHPTL